MSSSNYLESIAVVGAGGHVGGFIAESLLKAGKKVTAITRHDSDSILPDGVTPKAVDYAKNETLVDALRGHDALVITIGVSAPPGTQALLIRAAGEAGVPWILPNDWSNDTYHEGLVKDMPLFKERHAMRKLITDLGKSSYISVATGYWYEWSLAIAPAYGFDFEHKKVTLYDEGETKISTSTWPHIGRAVAAILSLPIHAQGSDTTGSLESFANQEVYTNSFTVSQKDIFASVLCVTSTKEADWTINKEPSHERFAAGAASVQKGDRQGFVKMIYTRVFFPDGAGDFETRRGTLNKLLGLLADDLDAATKRAIARSKAPYA